MIDIVQEILGIELGQTAYDDIILTGALIIGIMSILIIVQIFKRFLERM